MTDTQMMSEILELKTMVGELLRTRPKGGYTVKEFGEIVGLATATVREHCRSGRLNGVKGREGDWHLPHDELLRYQREGLVPDFRQRSNRRRLIGRK